MNFANAVKNIPSITVCYQNGLQAMGANSRMVQAKEPRSCNGSVDIDSCLNHAHPNAARWDYAIGYNDRAYFIEVHPAAGQVSAVIAKCQWLRTWLKTEGVPLAAIHGDGLFHWLSTGGVNVIGKDKLRLAQNKIVINALKL